MSPWLLPLMGVGFILACVVVAAIVEYIDDRLHPPEPPRVPPPNVRARRPWLIEDDGQ